MEKLFLATVAGALSVLVASVAASAATVTYELTIEGTTAQGTYEVRASSSGGDNNGIASYGFPLIGGVDTVDNIGPMADGVGDIGNAPLGFVDARSLDGDAMVSGGLINDGSRYVLFGVGQIQSSLTDAEPNVTAVSSGEAEGTLADPSNGFEANVLLAQGTWSETLPGIDTQSEDFLANVWSTGTSYAGAGNFNLNAEVADVALSVVDLTTLLGDTDMDGDIDAADIDTLFENFGSTDVKFDIALDGGAAGQSDVDALIQDILMVNVGDANLDGAVNFDDFLALQGRFGGMGGWANGDFNGDMMVNFDDFLALQGKFGSTSAPQIETSLQAIPEPSSVILVTFALFAATILARRGIHRKPQLLPA